MDSRLDDSALHHECSAWRSLEILLSTLIVGFDSAWTATNQGAVVGLIRHADGSFQLLGLPFVADFDAAERAIKAWQAEHAIERTIILIDQPTIVREATGQRPVENIVASAVSRRFGGMQPANTGRRGMFDEGAPIWPFLERFGGPADIRSCSRHTTIFETYPVLTIIARGWILPDERRLSGRLPKYNPVRRSTFRKDDWAYLCGKLSGFFRDCGVVTIADWIDSIQSINMPRKADQDCLDACLCLLVGLDIADGENCLVVGEQATGYIVTSDSELIASELTQRCIQTDRDPTRWIHSLALQNGISDCSV
jgi:predicted RNase H-like nuclease